MLKMVFYIVKALLCCSGSEGGRNLLDTGFFTSHFKSYMAFYPLLEWVELKSIIDKLYRSIYLPLEHQGRQNEFSSFVCVHCREVLMP